MSNDAIRRELQRRAQVLADKTSEVAEQWRAFSEAIGNWDLSDSNGFVLPPSPSDPVAIETPERARLSQFDYFGEFINPPIRTSNWHNNLQNVVGYSDNSIEVVTRPTPNGSEKVQQSIKLTGTRSYQVEQTVTLLEPFSWSQGKHIGGKLGMGLSTFEQVSGLSSSRGGMTSRFGFRNLGWPGRTPETTDTGLATIYAYHQKRPERWGEDFILGPLTIGIPTRMKMEVGLNSAFNLSDGWLKGWYEGDLVVDERNIVWQSESSVARKGVNDLGLWFLWFTLFHGGNDEQWSPEHLNRFRFENINHGVKI